MTGFTATLSRAERMELSHPYSNEHVGFLVRDFDRGKFATLETLNQGEGVVVAVPLVEGALEGVKTMLPLASTRSYQSIDEIIGDPAVTAALSNYVKVKFQAEDPEAEPAKSLMTRFKAIGLPTYVILRPATSDTRRSVP